MVGGTLLFNESYLTYSTDSFTERVLLCYFFQTLNLAAPPGLAKYALSQAVVSAGTYSIVTERSEICCT